MNCVHLIILHSLHLAFKENEQLMMHIYFVMRI